MTQWHTQIYTSALLPSQIVQLHEKVAACYSLNWRLRWVCSWQWARWRMWKWMGVEFHLKPSRRHLAAAWKYRENRGNSLRGRADPGSRSRFGTQSRHVKIKIKVKKKKKEEWKFLKIRTSSVGIWKQNSSGLLFAVPVCARDFFWLKIFPVCSSFFFFFFFLLFIKLHPSTCWPWGEGAGWRSRASGFQRRVRSRAAQEAMCSGESLSSVVVQQTGRLDCENRVRGILKSLGLDPFLYTVNGKEGVDVFFFFSFF